MSINGKRNSHFTAEIALISKTFIAGVAQTLHKFFQEPGQKMLRAFGFAFRLVPRIQKMRIALKIDT